MYIIAHVYLLCLVKYRTRALLESVLYEFASVATCDGDSNSMFQIIRS